MTFSPEGVCALIEIAPHKASESTVIPARLPNRPRLIEQPSPNPDNISLKRYNTHQRKVSHFFLRGKGRFSSGLRPRHARTSLSSRRASGLECAAELRRFSP